MKIKLIYDFRFYIWVLIAMLALLGAFTCDSFAMFMVYSIVSVMALLGVDIATRGTGWIVVNIIAALVCYFAGGFSSLIAGVLMFLIPAYGMSMVIKSKKDFMLTLCNGLLLMSLGIMIIDRMLAEPSFGGLRIAYGSIIDGLGASAAELSGMLSGVMGITASEAEVLLTTSCYTMKLMFPGFVMSVVFVIVLFALLGTRKIIFGIPVPSFFELKTSKAVAYTYCIGQIVALMMASDTGIIVMNVILVLSVVLFISGLSLLRFFTKLIPSKFISLIVFVFAFPVCCLSPQLIVTAGLADSVFDFRRFKNVKK